MAIDIRNIAVYADANATAYQPIAVITFESLVWEERYLETGEMQLVVPETDENVALFQLGRAVGIGASDTLMYIHTIKYTDKKIWVYGYEIKELLGKMAVLPESEIPTGVMTVADRILYVFDELINRPWLWLHTPVDANIPTLWVTDGTASDTEPKSIDSSTPQDDAFDYLELMTRFCKAGSSETKCYGLKLIYLASGKLQIKVYNGTDRSGAVVFSPALGNMGDVEYTVSDEGYYNAVYALSRGLNEQLSWTVSRSIPSGETERGYVLDLRDEYPLTEDMTNTAGGATEWSRELLNKAKMSRVARHRTKKVKYSTVSSEGYGTDYILGDIVKVVVPRYNIDMEQRIEAVTFTAEYGKTTTQITLDNV